MRLLLNNFSYSTANNYIIKYNLDNFVNTYVINCNFKVLCNIFSNLLIPNCAQELKIY